MTHTKLVQPKPANAGMVIYNINALNNTEKIAYLAFSSELSKKDSSHRLRGKTIKDWTPLKLKWCIGDQYLNHIEKANKDIIFNDFVLIVGAGVNIILNEKAKLILESKLDHKIQFLPVEILGSNDSKWYLINIVNKIDNAVSEEKSTYIDLPTGKRVLQKPVFNNEALTSDLSFVIPPACNTWYTKGEQLKELVEKNGLSGLKFNTCEVDTTKSNQQ